MILVSRYGVVASSLPTGGPSQIVIATDSSPYVAAYLWDNGFSTKYANPASTLGYAAGGVAFTPTNTEVVLTYTGTASFFDGMKCYRWSELGFGSAFSSPSSSNGGTSHAKWNPANTAFARAFNYSPYAEAWSWNGSTFGSKYANPATLPTGTGNGVAWSKNGNQIAFAHATAPYVSVYPWSPGFGSKYANPVGLNATSGLDVNFRFNDDTLLISHVNTPYATAYPWSPGFGTKYADPATLPSGNAFTAQFSPDGSNIAMSNSTTPFIHAYPWSAGWGSKYANPATLPPATSPDLAWKNSGDVVAVGSYSSSPTVTAYPFASGFGTKYANPATPPTGWGTGLSFTN